MVEIMKMSVRLAPPNSTILIEDSGGGEIPKSMNHSLVASTGSCITVGCRAENDGETEIVLDDYRESDAGEFVFDGVLSTTTRKLAVRTVLGDTLLEIPVVGIETKLRILTNDSSEPDYIEIGLVQ